MNYLNRALLAVGCFTCIAQAEQTTPTFYQKLGEMVLSAEQQITQQNSKPAVQLTSQATKKEEEKVDLTVRVASRAEQLQTLFTLLDQTAPISPENRIFGDDVAEKLNLLSGTPSDKKHSLLDNLPLQSIVGTTSAAEMLLLCDSTERNQEVVQYFVSNPTALRATQKALQKIEAGVGLYLTFFKPLNEAEQKTFDKVFFGKWLTRLNKNVPALTALRTLQRGTNLIRFLPASFMMYASTNYGITHGKITILNEFKNNSQIKELRAGLGDKEDIILSATSALRKAGLPEDLAKSDFINDIISGREVGLPEKIYAYGIETPKNILKNVVLNEFHKHNPFKYAYKTATPTEQDHKDYIKSWALSLIGLDYVSLGDRIINAQDPHGMLSTNKMYGWIFLSTALIDAWNGYNAYVGTKDIQFDNTIINNLHIRLMGVAKIAEGLAELNEIAQNADTRALGSLVQEISQLLAHIQGSSDTGSLISNLLTDTFKGNETSYLANRPRILATYTLLNENKTVFVPALRVAGMFDALQAAAQLYLDHEDKAAHYTFVQLPDTELPSIQLTNFWNPLMRAGKAVCNSVHLGQGGDRNMLLTGPNGSGKSVNMKAIALNIILAQAFGIAAADRAIMSEFTMIETYLNEQEDLQQGLSTFMAEAKKLDTICKRIANLKPGQKSFVLMDEMLKGTVEEAGSQKVYEAGLEIAQQENNICIMATHFLKPTDLEADTNGGFVNYHVELLEPTLGEFVRTFKLVPEANLWWFGKTEEDTAKRTRFIKWLTKNLGGLPGGGIPRQPVPGGR